MYPDIQIHHSLYGPRHDATAGGRGLDGHERETRPSVQSRILFGPALWMLENQNMSAGLNRIFVVMIHAATHLVRDVEIRVPLLDRRCGLLAHTVNVARES